MKKPATPPPLQDLWDMDRKLQTRILEGQLGPTVEGRYRHWDSLRHLTPPEGVDSQQWWQVLRWTRLRNERELLIRDPSGNTYGLVTCDPLLEMLHEIDPNAKGQILLDESGVTDEHRDRYVVSSLMEEAITSSQLEGAAITRVDASVMLREQREPRGRSERMVLNNYRAMEWIKGNSECPITPKRVLELHELITRDTLDDSGEAGRLRRADEDVAVVDPLSGELHYRPPHADELEARLEGLCEFANEARSTPFLHPVVRAVLVHFWLAVDHPFVDGNGRVARALFYWCMLSRGYWLTEFLSISSILKQAPAKYARSFLYAQSDRNDATYFVLAQLSVVLRAIDSTQSYLRRKLREVRDVERLLAQRGALNTRQLALLAHALRHPGHEYTVRSHQTSHRVVLQTARTDLTKLTDLGLLQSARRGRAFRYWASSGLEQRIRSTR